MLETFAAQVAAAPHRPFLFYREGWEWHWLSAGVAAKRIDAAADRLARWAAGDEAWAAGPGVPAPPDSAARPLAVAFPSRAEPSLFLLDLAIRSAGLTAVPVSGAALREPGAAAERGAVAWAEPDEGRVGPREVPAASGELPRLTVSFTTPSPAEADAAAETSPGSVVVAGGDGGFETVSPDALATAVEALEEELAEARREQRRVDPRPRGERDVGVSWRGLDDPGERLFLTWAVKTGAALALEPDAEAAISATAWARPSVIHAGPEHLAALAEAARVFRPAPFTRRRLPFGRLAFLLWSAERSPKEELAAFWRDKGSAIVPLPALSG